LPAASDVDDGRYSLAFDGASADVTMQNPQALQLSGALSLVCWVKFLALGGAGTAQHIMGKGQGLGGTSDYTLTLIGSTNTIYFDLMNGAATRASLPTNTVFASGGWYHLAATWDGTAGTNGMKFYVNSALDAQGTSAFAAPVDSTMNFTLGNYYTPGSWGTWRLNGLLGEPRVYGRQLSAAEVAALYANGVTPPGPAAEWLFAEGAGPFAYDTSGASVNGTISGAIYSPDLHP
jgi:hypothetical protein